ncbi:MAG TPA: hypothetical protein VIP48_07275 [Streptosporangiaceae bacterium]
MKYDVIERLEALLRDEGFNSFSTRRASHDVTLTAARGETRLVTHLSDRVSVPSRAQPHEDVPDPSVIAVRPQVPGVPSDPVTGSPGRAGGSGGGVNGGVSRAG